MRYSSLTPDVKEMKDWIWASANEPIFMSYHNIGKAAFVDGGVRENVPVMAALEFAKEYNTTHEQKIYDIDVVVNKPENPLINTSFKKRGILGGLNRLIDIWSMEVRKNDIDIAKLKAQSEIYAAFNKEAIATEPAYRIHIYYLPADMFVDIYQKELLFDKKRMSEFWKAGEEGKRDGDKLLPDTIIIPEPLLIQLFANKK